MTEARPSSHSRAGAPALERVELGWDLPGVHGVAVLVPADEERLRALTEGLAEPPPRAVAKRRKEFLAGRYAAAVALGELGRSERAVGRDAAGAPLFPAGTVGSISHTDTLAVAVAASADVYLGLGIDIERVVTLETSRELGSVVMNEEELALVRRAAPARAALGFALVFSAKESAYKCLFPLTGTFLDFSDLRVTELELGSAGDGSLRLSLVPDLSPCFARNTSLTARLRFDGFGVRTLVALEREVA